MRGGQRAPMAPSQENWGLARVGWRGCCGGRVPSFLEQKQPPPPLSGAGGARHVGRCHPAP